MTPVNPVSNQIFTEPQRQLLVAALNRLILAEGEFPGAGDLGLAAFVERAVSRETSLTRTRSMLRNLSTENEATSSAESAT